VKWSEFLMTLGYLVRRRAPKGLLMLGWNAIPLSFSLSLVALNVSSKSLSGQQTIVGMDPRAESAVACSEATSVNRTGAVTCFGANWRPFATAPRIKRSTSGWLISTRNGSSPLSQLGQASADVKFFGAKCDDSVDDTSAIQAALASLPDKGGVVLFPPNGICKISTTIHIRKPHIIFQGYSSRQFITSDTPSSYIDFAGTNQHALSVDAQGFMMDGMAVKYPAGTGGAIAPDAAPVLSPMPGTLPAGSYYAESTCINALGESMYSNESKLVLSVPGGISVAAPRCAGNGAAAIGWQAYASTSSGNETRQNTTVIPITTSSYVISSKLVNNGKRQIVDQSAACAIFDNNAGKYHNVAIFSDASSPALSDGICLVGSSAQVDMHSFFSGFNRGVSLRGDNNNTTISGSFFQKNRIAVQAVSGAEIHIEENDFEGNLAEDVEILSGIAQISRNYFEQQNSAGEVNLNIKIGSNLEPMVSGQTSLPTNTVVEDNFIQCNGTSGSPPIEVQRVGGFLFNNNNITNCQNHTVVVLNSWANSNAGIRMLGNISSSNIVKWVSSLAGIVESDWSDKSFQVGRHIIYNNRNDCTCPEK
jgi:hypothetical protein